MFRKTVIFLSFLLTASFAAYCQTQPKSIVGTPAEVVLTPYKTTLVANGKDEAIIKVTIVDKQGDEIFDATNPIQFFVTGDAKIIRIEKSDSGKENITKVSE